MEGYRVRRVYRGAVYEIEVSNPRHVQKGVASIRVDGEEIAGQVLPAAPAGRTVRVTVTMG